MNFIALGRPIIADQVGGLASLAICAFGASSGFAHGITGKNDFTLVAGLIRNPELAVAEKQFISPVWIDGLSV